MKMIIKKNGKLPESYVIPSEVILVNGCDENGVYPTCYTNNGVVYDKGVPDLVLAMNSVINGYNSTEPDENHNS
jgi:hypothetical protein